MEAVAALAVRYYPVGLDTYGKPLRPAPIINRVAWPDEPFLQPQGGKNDDPGLVHPMARLLEGVIDAQQTKILGGVDRAESLSFMRQQLANMCDARVCLGGKTSGFSGRMPGVIEEALCTLELERPIYCSAIFGGASARLADAMEKGNGELNRFLENFGLHHARESIQMRFRGVKSGLAPEEEFRLRHSNSIEEIIELTLRGVVKSWGANGRHD
jgi:hypothetical protein